MAGGASRLSQGRDLRLDLFRGFANWAIFVDHIPNNAVALADDQELWLQRRRRHFRLHFRIYGRLRLCEEDGGTGIHSGNGSADAPRLAALCGSRTSVRCLICDGHWLRRAARSLVSAG